METCRWVVLLGLSLVLVLVPSSAEAQSDTQLEDGFFDFSFDEFDDKDGLLDSDDVLDANCLDLDPSSNCTAANVTVVPLDRDQLLEGLVKQAWSELKAKSFSPDFTSIQIDPLDMRDHMNSSISFQQTTTLYSADLNISRMVIEGLSRMEMLYTEIYRDENLTMINMNTGLTIDVLTVTGDYSLKGSFGWWDLDSNGVKPFSIFVSDMTWTPELEVKILNESAHWAQNCFTDYGIALTEIGLPSSYSNATFVFEGIGSFANSVINGLGAYILQTHGDILVQQLKTKLEEADFNVVCKDFIPK